MSPRVPAPPRRRGARAPSPVSVAPHVHRATHSRPANPHSKAKCPSSGPIVSTRPSGRELEHRPRPKPTHDRIGGPGRRWHAWRARDGATTKGAVRGESHPALTAPFFDLVAL